VPVVRPDAALVNGATLTAGSGNVAPGDSIVIPLEASLGSETLGAATIEIHYDPAVLQATACTPDPGDLFDTALCNFELAPDKVGLTAISAGGVSGDPRLAEVTFQAVGTAGDSTLLTLTADPFSDPGGLAVAVTLQHGLVNIVSVARLPHTLTLVPDPSTIRADGISTSLLTAEVVDEQGDPVEDGTVVVYSTDAGTFPGGLAFTPTPNGILTAEAESADAAKVGTWIEYGDTQASGGKGLYSNGIGDKVTFEFTGTQVSILFQKQFNAGLAEVFVDGVSYGKIDTYWDDGSGTGKLYQQEEQIVTDLPYVPHQIEVVVTGDKNPASADSYLVVDAFRVFGTDRNGAYLTNSGVSTVTLKSATTPGTAQVTACAGAACDTEPVYFRHPQGYLYLPVVLKYRPPAPGPECEELIRNGGFENNTAWIRGVTPRTARYTTEQVQEGARSMLLGLKPGETDVRSYSSVRQTISLPADIDWATLSFWYYPISELDNGDRQDVLLLNEHDQLVAILMRTNTEAEDWTEMSYDLSDYAGQTLQVYFNAYNDGDGEGVAAYYLDDVSVEACEGEKPPPEPPPTPPVPPDCYPKFQQNVDVGQVPHGVAINSNDKRLYVANHQEDTLSVINSETYGVVATVDVGKRPNGVAYNAANNMVYVANRDANSVTVLTASDMQTVATLTVGKQPNGVAVNASTNKVYVANYGSGTVSVINGADNTVGSPIPVGTGPSMVAVNPTTNKAYVSLHGEGKVAVIHGNGAVTKVDLYSNGPYGIAVDTVRNLVYVATIDTYRIVAVDGNTDTFLGWAEIRRMPNGEPVPLRMIAVNPLIGTSGHIFATTTEKDGGWNKFLLLPKGWPEYFARAHAMPLSEPQEGIVFEPASLRVFVTSRAGDLVAVYLDGEPACATNFGTRSAVPEDYQLKICIAGPDGTCAKTFIR
jgi:YVTN family beta-propeller protein